MKLSTLCTGCANAFGTVLGIVCPRFESFTILQDEGVLSGEREPVLVAKIAAEDAATDFGAADAVAGEAKP